VRAKVREGVRDVEVKLRGGVGFMEEVGSKSGVKDRGSYGNRKPCVPDFSGLSTYTGSKAYEKQVSTPPTLLRGITDFYLYCIQLCRF